MDKEKRLIRSFGRIKTRKLSPHKEKLFSDLLPNYEIKEFNKNLIQQFSQIHLEIGFGFGDFTFENAKRNPDILFIACETHINGIVSLLSKLEKTPLNNIKIFTSDVRLFLQSLKIRLFNKVYILFPDPWPKTKHFKRRLINESFLKDLSEKMTKDAQLIIASDHDSYKRWILSEIFKNNLFDWQAKSKADWQNFPDDWVYTKYQKKAQREGRKSVFLRYCLF